MHILRRRDGRTGKGAEVKEAIYAAKEFITAAIKESFPLNQYIGPTKHSAMRLSGK